MHRGSSIIGALSLLALAQPACSGDPAAGSAGAPLDASVETTTPEDAGSIDADSAARDAGAEAATDAGAEAATDAVTDAKADVTHPRGWRPMAHGPLRARYRAMSAWSGSEVLVWGGITYDGVHNTFFDDGAAYDPDVDTWRPIPTAPIVRRSLAVAIWTGAGFFVWGGIGTLRPDAGSGAQTYFNDGAVFDPSAQRWQALPTSPLAARVQASAVFSTTTQEVIIWGGLVDSGSATDGAAYKPATSTWRTIASSPLAARDGQAAVWNGTKMVIYGGKTTCDGGSCAVSDAAEYDPMADAWTTVDTSPSGLGARMNAGATTVSGEAVFLGGEDTAGATFGSGASFNETTRAWRAIRAPTSAELANPARRSAFLWSTGGNLWLYGGSWSYHNAVDGAWFDAVANTWTGFPAGFTKERGGVSVGWTGADLFVWGGIFSAQSFDDGALYRP